VALAATAVAGLPLLVASAACLLLLPAGLGVVLAPKSLLVVRRQADRQREVLALMAEGHSNAGIASRLVVTEKAVNKHIGNIFTKLGLYPDEDANRRVLAVLTYLNA
jgi:biotin operon repressor